MAVSTTLSPPRPKRFSLALRVVIVLLVFVLALFLLADIWFFRAAKASLPVVDGTLKLSGLAAPVIVTRDSLGVPNISAQILHDLFFAQGYRDRAGPPLADGHDAPLRFGRPLGSARPRVHQDR